MNIKKIIAQTALGTCSMVLVAVLFTFNILAVFFPKNLSDASDYIGFKALAVKMSEVAYQKSKNINDLSIYVERSIKYQDYDAVKASAKLLINHDEYENFVKFKNNQEVSEFSDYKNYIEGNYIISLFTSGDKSGCLEEVIKQFEKTYDIANPIRFLARHLQLSQSKFPEFLSLLINKHDEVSDKTQKENLSLDILAIYLSQEDKENIALWQKIYTQNKLK